MLAVDRDHCKLYELFAASRGTSRWSADSGAVFDLTSNALRPEGWTSADAAGLPIFPGLVRYDEVASGHIDHALRFTVSKSQQAYLHPATHDASSSTDPNLPPMGLRLRLKASFNTSSFTGQARVVLDALKKYGMIVADNGSNWFISGAADTRWNDTDLEPAQDGARERVRSREHGRVAAQVARTRTYSRPVRFSTRPDPEPVGPGQESAWDYPRPPRARAGARSAHGRARRRHPRRHDARVPGARDQPPAQLLLPARRRHAGGADARRRRFVLRVEGPRALLHRARRRTRRGGAAWAYATPSPAFAAITDHVAFYAGRMDACFVDGERVAPQPGGFYGGWITAASSARSRAGPAPAAGDPTIRPSRYEHPAVDPRMWPRTAGCSGERGVPVDAGSPFKAPAHMVEDQRRTSRCSRPAGATPT